jgi:hypothetical protein
MAFQAQERKAKERELKKEDDERVAREKGWLAERKREWAVEQARKEEEERLEKALRGGKEKLDEALQGAESAGTFDPGQLSSGTITGATTGGRVSKAAEDIESRIQEQKNTESHAKFHSGWTPPLTPSPPPYALSPRTPRG